MIMRADTGDGSPLMTTVLPARAVGDLLAYNGPMGQEAHREVADTVFDANLADFAAKVTNICALEAGEKITPKEAYDRIKAHWKMLKRSKRNLLDEPSSEEDSQAT